MLQILSRALAAIEAHQKNAPGPQAQTDPQPTAGMVDALLSLSVTYRQLIMPLVRAMEKRVGLDSSLHQKIERLERQFQGLEKK